MNNKTTLKILRDFQYLLKKIHERSLYKGHSKTRIKKLALFRSKIEHESLILAQDERWRRA
ncbi:hypothetical protein HMPREF1011_02107 [Anaerostipes caccae]|nr:hypothetical protein HMPREF1011_02107 [Anaerostipes caccae]